MNIRIIGCGFIGGVLKNWLQNYNLECNTFVSDPLKGLNDNLQDCNIAFISIHIPTKLDGTQYLTLLKKIISQLPNIPIFIRTPVLPNTCNRLSAELRRNVNFMPEFLTQRNADKNFAKQTMIFTTHKHLLHQIFPGKNYLVMSSLEAEISKYAHNVFGARKVTFFNRIKEYCKLDNCNYSSVLNGILASGYINSPPHGSSRTGWQKWLWWQIFSSRYQCLPRYFKQLFITKIAIAASGS